MATRSRRGARSPDGRAELGRLGEAAAREHLRRQGMRILAERHRSPLGEIDLIAEDRGTIVFVEVKTRSSSRFGSPEESVTPDKQRRLARLAALFLAEKGLSDKDCRFDVVAVEAEGGGNLTLRHVRDAFRL